MTTNIRTPRGRWAVLSPAYPWPVKDRLKTYPSLLNYLADDCITKPTKLLTERLKVGNDRVVSGMKLLLFHNPQFKNYLHCSPKNIRYVNRYHPELEVFYTSNLLSARDAISKFRIKGDEVIEKQKELEMLGAVINGDEAVFDYDAREDVDKLIYNVDSKGWNEEMTHIANMIETYIYINDENPPFIEEMEIYNPSIFYIAKKHHGENIAKLLTRIDTSEFKPLEMENLEELLVKTQELTGSAYMYYIFPKKLHYSLKEYMSLSDVRKMLKYHIENNTSNVPEIMTRLKLFDSLTQETKKDEMRKIIMEEFLDKDEENFVFRTEPSGVFYVDTEEELDKLNDESYQGPIVEEVVDAPPIVDEGSLESAISFHEEEVPPPPNYPPPPLEDPSPRKPSNDLLKTVKDLFKKIVKEEAEPAIKETVRETVKEVVKEKPHVKPVVMEVVKEKPVVMEEIKEVDFDEKFPMLDNATPIGKIIEPDEAISPFNTRMIVFEDVKYKGIISAIYNLAIKDLLNSTRVYSSAPSTLRKKLLQEVSEEDVVSWWKDKGWRYLEQILSTEQYVEKLYSHRHIDKKPFIFLASKRAISEPLLEQYIGAIKTSPGDDKTKSIPWKGSRLKGWNCAGALI